MTPCAKGDNADRERVKPRILLIYAVFGPPVGGLIVYAAFLLYALFSDMWWLNVRDDPYGILLSLASGAIGFPLMAYMFGGVQAALTGLFIKILAGPEGRFGYGAAVLAPTIVGILVCLVFYTTFYLLDGYTPVETPLILGGIGVLASLILRFLFRRRFRKIEAQLVGVTVRGDQSASLHPEGPFSSSFETQAKACSSG